MSLRAVRSLSLLAGLAGAAVLPASAQPAFQVADINPATETSAHWLWLFDSMAALGSTVVFAADDGPQGLEIWKSDGTAAGTALVKDICPGSCWSFPRQFTASGERLFFFADDGSHGIELWTTDGTPAGTRMVKDIQPGLASGSASLVPPVAMNGLVFFTANDGVHGAEIWKSDGTEAGTEMVADIVPGPGHSSPVIRAASGSRVFFIADDRVHGEEPWISDGTAAGTALLKDIAPGANSSLLQLAFNYPWLVTSGDRLVFLADDGVHGPEPWVSDGTATGTALLADLRPGTLGSFAQSFTELGGNLYFSANGGDGTGWELWRSAGLSGATLVKDIQPDEAGRFTLTAAGGLLFFHANDGVHGLGLWKSDGTAAGTQRVEDLTTHPDSASFPPDRHTFRALGSVLLFTLFDGAGLDLWRSDGTEAGTFQVTHLSPDITPGFIGSAVGFVVAGESLYYRAQELSAGLNLWKSDGTETGTGRVKDIGDPTDSLSMFTGFQAPEPGPFVAHDGVLHFLAGDGATVALWKSDGTPAGTGQLSPAVASVHSGFPYQLVSLGATQVFAVSGNLWKTDGTPGGTVEIDWQSSAPPNQLTRLGQHVYLSRSEPGPVRSLWRTDGTAAGTGRVAVLPSEPWALTASGGRLFFTSDTALDEGSELWASDGTHTWLVRDILPGKAGSHPGHLIDAPGTLFFYAEHEGAGYELWKSDGTEAGTVLVKDVRPGPESFVTNQYLTCVCQETVGRTLYFVADDGVSGAELWKSDGTEAGTVLVKDIFPGTRGSEPTDLTRVRNRLFFVADDGVHGRELWVSDGTEAGTVLVADLVPGAESSLPQQLAAMGHILLFSAWDATHGREPWKSDGTAAGTLRLDDIAPGVVSSSPVQFTAGFPNVYFGATDGVTGFEPWAFPRSLLGGTFADVPADFWAFRWVEALADAGITGGCGPGNYCPDQAVSRAAAAVFLLRASRGEAFLPPPATGTRFGDVPAGYWAAAWIEQLAADGVTGGCGGGNFCPEDPLTRAELAVLLLRARFGPDFLPPSGTGMVFSDVPAGSWARDWIEHLVALGVTGGCGNGNYCPERPVTRAEMAIFVARAFELPTP